MTMHSIKQAFLKMDRKEQQEFAQYILSYFLFLAEKPAIADVEIHPLTDEQQVELFRRSQEIHEGKVSGFSLAEVEQKLREKHAI